MNDAPNFDFFLDESCAIDEQAVLEALANPTRLPDGMLEHSLAEDIHALICLKGFEEARRLVAEILNYEADRRPKNG